MYEIFESQVDNIEISREYNYLRNYKIEEINGGDCPKTRMSFHQN